ncbi:hypothetical protein J7E87_32470 [Streptomyces sp. ISL-1]|nr:hypothetical protein [Streptomyces sp. ISL-1]MBT2393999.1 hypothetical protein [Streptomyces sp. ISL-1]
MRSGDCEQRLTMDWGIKHRDIGLVDEAHTMLENLRLETGKNVWGGWRA